MEMLIIRRLTYWQSKTDVTKKKRNLCKRNTLKEKYSL